MEPIVAIIGRPNVGKSTLFNRIVGRRQAIVGEFPGVTRDRHYGRADWLGHHFVLVDTGGIDVSPDEELDRLISEQSVHAVAEADVIICVMDGRSGPIGIDEALVKMLRAKGKPIVYAANKVDSEKQDNLMADFHRLGLDPVIGVSAEHGRGVDEVLDAVIEHFPEERAEPDEVHEGARVAVVGRPNVGKSTLINQLAGEQRVVASEIAGTTRDTIDVDICWEDNHYIFVDTGGIRRKSTVRKSLDRFTIVKSLHAIERSDVVCILLDASEGLTRQDLNLASFAYEEGKGVIIVVNKWDLMEMPQDEYREYLERELKEMSHLPVVCLSALTGKFCSRLLPLVQGIFALLEQKIPSGKLNGIIKKVLTEHHIPMYNGKEVKFYYATQVNTYPPTLLIFTNYPDGLSTSTRRYVSNRIKMYMGIENIPLKIVYKKRH